MIILLIVFTAFFIVLSYYYYSKDIFNPSFIYSSLFFLSFFDYLLNAGLWGDISILTLLVIIAGISSFEISTFIVHYLYQSNRRKNHYSENEFKSNSRYIIDIGHENISTLKTSRAFWILFFIFEIICVILVAQQVINLTYQYGGGGNLSTSIALYQRMSKFTTVNMRMPTLLIYLFVFIQSGGYISGYLVINNFLSQKKIDIFLLIITLISISSSMLTGSRGGSLQHVITLLFIFIILYCQKNDIKKADSKIIFRVFLVLLLLLLSFETFAGLMGRDNSLNLFEYISVYLGAPIKNLDIFLSKFSGTKSNVFGSYTFVNQINWIGNHFNIKKYQYSINLPFNYIDGHNLGNVYSCFYSYYYDFGLGGVVVLSSISAVFIQILYENIQYKSGRKIHLIYLVYSFFLFTLMFSFFANRFYGSFNVTTFERIVIWLFMAELNNLYNRKNRDQVIKKIKFKPVMISKES